VVEDQEDVRRMLQMALQIDGHNVDLASSAHEGLTRLRDSHYDLVLSDYSMPGQTGAWMLHEAAREGLLGGTATLIVTAHPEIEDLSDVEVISKPLDLDLFLDQVRRILTPGAAETQPARESAPLAPHKVELVLYVTPRSPSSIQARQQLEHVLEAYDPTQVNLEICDLSRDPGAGEVHRVAFTPTLVKRLPGPPVWILGALRDPAILTDLLRACGVDRHTPAS